MEGQGDIEVEGKVSGETVEQDMCGDRNMMTG